MTHFAGKGQMRALFGIDPAQPVDDADSATSTVASGLLRPAASQKISGTTIASAPLWMIPNPKDANTYVYDANGSAYTLSTTNTVTALADGGSLSSSLGNGGAYYDNYLYFIKNTDVCRYGPLNGSAAFNATYWTGTLSKGALTNTTYPKSFKNNIQYPNHVAHRHSDGALYIADVVGNQGVLHKIKTTKVSVEGDTDNGSTASILTFGYGLYPMAIDSLGSNVAVALVESSFSNKRDMKAKLAIWDTTSTSFNSITWVEFPDPLITAMKNVDGILHIISGNYNARGFRVSKHLGGYSFGEVYYSETGEPCFSGALEAILHRLLIGSYTNVPESDGCVYSLGLQKGALGGSVFKSMRATGGTASTAVTALAVINEGSNVATEFGFYTPTIGWTQAGEGSTGMSHGLDQQGTQYNNAPSVAWSDVFKIGQPFEIQKIRIPFVQTLATNMTVTAKIYFDDNAATKTLTTINSTNFPNSAETNFGRAANIKTDNTGSSIGRGENNFFLELRWSGSALATIGFPILIDIIPIPD